MDKQEIHSALRAHLTLAVHKGDTAKAEGKGKPTSHPHPEQDREFLKQVSTTACQDEFGMSGERVAELVCLCVPSKL